MTYRLLILLGFCFIMVKNPVSAYAESQIYNPYTTGVTYYQLQREHARQQRRIISDPGATRGYIYSNRNVRRPLTDEERQVLAIEKNLKKRFPVHPAFYRDAYDRGTFTKHTGPGNNPRDSWLD